MVQGKRLSRGYGQQGRQSRAPKTPLLGRSKTSEKNGPGNGGTGVPLVVKYNPFLSCLGQV